MDKKIFGIDIGGSSVKYGIADQDGSITCTGAFPVSGDMGRQAFLDKLSSLCLEAREQGSQGLGISTLGLVDSRTGTIVGGAENLPFLIGANLKEALGSVFNRDHICVHNDADCFALGELWKGNAQDARSFFCLALGTGIGGSLVIDGALVQGRSQMTRGKTGIPPKHVWRLWGRVWESPPCPEENLWTESGKAIPCAPKPWSAGQHSWGESWPTLSCCWISTVSS